MTRWPLVWIVILVSATLTACGGSPTAAGTVVVTTNILGDVVRNVVGDQATVNVLMQPNADPHSFGVSAKDATAMSSAGLIVYNGLGLEEGVTGNVETAAAEGVSTLPVGESVDPLPYVDGESAGNPDPHFWTDPRRIIGAVDAVEAAVIRNVEGVDPAVVTRNAERYRDELRSLDTWMVKSFSAIPVERRKLVTNHHVLGYLAHRFGFTVLGAIVPSGTTLAAPSSKDLSSLVTAIQSAKVPAIFVDSSQPERLANVLADETGMTVRIVPLYSESLSPPGTPGATYLDMMRANTEAIVSGLR